MVTIQWIPENKRPANADRWQEVIDAAYGSPAAGRVELVWETTCWRVRHATVPAGGAYTLGDNLEPVWRDRKANVEEALTRASLPVCSG